MFWFESKFFAKPRIKGNEKAKKETNQARYGPVRERAENDDGDAREKRNNEREETRGLIDDGCQTGIGIELI